MILSVRLKLSAMMFLQYFVWGAWYVTMGTWLGETLHFSGEQIGLAAGTTALAAMISPFFVGMVADRFMATERILAVLHLLGGVVLFFASTQTTFGGFYGVLLVYTLCYMPTLALSNSLSFRQMADPGREFPPIRVLGTIGWIVAGLCIGTLGLEATAMPLRIAGGGVDRCSACSASRCRTRRRSRRRRATRATCGDVLGLDALKLLGERSFAIFVLGSFLDLHPAAVLLRVREPVPERDARDERRGEDDARPDVRDLLHARDAVVLPPARREVDAARRHGGVDGALRVLRVRQQRAISCGCSTPASCCTASATTSSS